VKKRRATGNLTRIFLGVTHFVDEKADDIDTHIDLFVYLRDLR
jgi:hypothetical protein